MRYRECAGRKLRQRHAPVNYHLQKSHRQPVNSTAQKRVAKRTISIACNKDETRERNALSSELNETLVKLNPHCRASCNLYCSTARQRFYMLLIMGPQ